MIKILATRTRDRMWWSVQGEHFDYRFRSLLDAVAFVRSMRGIVTP